jgi:Kef-type K+ transport system membrane component KefB/Trk K+ transport system NAD-binding subunit
LFGSERMVYHCGSSVVSHRDSNLSDHSLFSPLLIITLLAVLVPLVVRRVKVVPIVVGEILAGMVLGKSGFGVVQPSPTLNFLAQFGFVFLMFLSGLEMSFSTLFPDSTDGNSRSRHPLPLALACFALTLAMAMAFSFGGYAAGLPENPALMGLILSTTSLGIVVPILKERGMSTTHYGESLFLAALVSDFATLLLLSLTVGILSRGFTLDLLLFLVLIGAFLGASKLSKWADSSRMLNRVAAELSHATSQIRVRGAVALMVAWVVLAESFGVEIILGAFLAGAIMSASSQGKETVLREKLDAIGYGFFIPVFFIHVGTEFDLGALISSRTAMLLAPAMIAVAYVVKLVPALLFRRMFTWRESIAAGVLLSSRLSLIIAAAAIAVDLGVISSAVNSAVILVAIVTCTLSPIIFSQMLPPPETARREGVVLLGTEQLAVLLGQRLRKDGERVTFIGRDQDQLERLKDLGFTSIIGNPDDEAVLSRSNLETARALIAVSTAPDLLLSVCRFASERCGVPVVIARADDPELVRALQEMNVRVVQPALAISLAFEAGLQFPAAFELLLDKQDDFEMVDVPLSNRALEGKALRKVRLPGNALVVGIQRQGEVVVPHGDTVLRARDTLLLVGSAESIRQARSWLAAEG